MIPDDKRWQKLNAYVDGELDAGEAAEIAARVAGDRNTAAAVATLTRLKATTATAVPAPPPGLLGAAHPRTAARWAAAAAAVVVVAAGALVLWLMLAAPAAPDQRLAGLIERHEAWARQPDGSAVDSSAAASVLVALGRFGGTAEIPDLSDAGLQLARIALFGDGDAAGLHVGYIGSRGCRVSLIIEAAAAGAPPPARAAATDVAAWTVDRVAYTLLASGMHPPRFAVIAASAEAATRSRTPLAPPMREALRDQRDTSPPCLG